MGGGSAGRVSRGHRMRLEGDHNWGAGRQRGVADFVEVVLEEW
jgi:hypothetical protein